MASDLEEKEVQEQQRDQMLKLVTKGFYHELTNFGVETKEILRVASHLLDNVMSEKDPPDHGIPYLNGVMDLDTVKDDWAEHQTLTVDGVALRPIQPDTVPLVADWLSAREIRESFVPAFPETASAIEAHFSAPTSSYFEVLFEHQPVGIVGGEDIDPLASKLAMKKLVGDPQMHGKGIGKRATFGFLYYAFMIMEMNKVYVHSRDINIRNINLNSRFGFELEGIFFEDVLVDGRRRDVVRMALLKKAWLEVFSPAQTAGP